MVGSVHVLVPFLDHELLRRPQPYMRGQGHWQERLPLPAEVTGVHMCMCQYNSRMEVELLP